MKVKWKEEEIAKAIKEHFLNKGWEVYSEVQVFRGGHVADMVVTNGIVYYVIETKTIFGLSVIDQAQRWRYYCHGAYVGVPEIIGRSFASDVARKYGIGIIQVARYHSREEEPQYSISIYTRPEIIRHPEVPIKEFLCDDQKLVTAGKKGANYPSAYRSMMRKVKEFVLEHPGCTLKEANKEIEGYYGHSTSGLYSALRQWEYKWCCMDKEKNILKLSVSEDKVEEIKKELKEHKGKFGERYDGI